MKIRTVFLFLFVSLIWSCGEDDESSNDQREVDLELNENVAILPENSTEGLIEVTAEALVFESSSNFSSRFEVGNIIVSGISSPAPHGFLRRITSIEEIGSKFILSTENAKLSDAIKSGSVYFEKEFDASEFMGKTDPLEMDITFSDALDISGDLTIKPKIIFEMVAEDWRLDYLKMGLGISKSYNAYITLTDNYNLEIEKELFEKDLPSVQIWVGGIFPIVITPDFEIAAGFEHNGPGVTLSFSLESESEYYVLKDSYGWSAHKDMTESAQLIQPELSVSTQASLYIKPIMEFQFYDIDAFETELYIKKSVIAEASLSIGEGIGCQVFCEVALGAGLEIEVLGFDEINPSIEPIKVQFPPFYECEKAPLSTEIEEIIPENLFEELVDLDMPINGGINPPIIEGSYFITPFIFKNSNVVAEHLTPGDDFSDYTYTFTDQNATDNSIKVTYESSSGNDSAEGLGSYVAGEGNAFSIFTEITGVSDGIPYKSVHIISGEIGDSGIRNFHKSFIFKEKGDDPTGELIAVGEGRVCYDSDGVSEKQ